MDGDDISVDRYDVLAELYERRWDQQQVQPKERKTAQAQAELTDDVGDVELGFHPTYQPSRFEKGWLLSSLASFYDQAWLSDVLALVKGGKEANVYLCLGRTPVQQAFELAGAGRRQTLREAETVHAQSQEPALLAAKVYRPQMFRNLRNDKLYRDGREILTVEGKAAGKAAGTIARAMRNKTPWGMEARHVSWLSHEYAALQRLYAAGAAVPQPVASNENTVLMEYCGDERRAAPTLHSVRLGHAEAERVLDEVIANVRIMLQSHLIHGDLSAYNILYWRGKISIIDWPQVIDPQVNQHARRILERDLTRVCEYFQLQGVECDPAGLTAELWGQYVE